jgi:hypothetical protein
MLLLSPVIIILLLDKHLRDVKKEKERRLQDETSNAVKNMPASPTKKKKSV